MPPIGIAVGLGMMAYGTTLTGIASLTMVFGGLLQVAMSVVSMTQAGIDEPAPEAAGQMINTRDPQKNLPLIYGQQRVGVNIVYMTSSGADNKYLYLIGTICEGPIDSIAQRDSVDQVWLDDKLASEYGALVSYTLYTGTSTQTTCGCPGYADPLRYTAYLYVVIQYDRDKFMRVPDITVEVKGLKVYDTRTSTTAYSTNPALCAYDFITRPSRRGGMEIDSGRIITTSVNSAANYCDTKSWTCNLVLRDQESAIDMVNKILVTFRGDLIYSQCYFQLLYKDLNYESSIMSISTDDVVEINKKSSLKIIQPSIFDTPNSARVKFPNYDNKHIIDDYVLVDSTAVTSDGDFREKTYTLDGITSYACAMKMANYLLERERVNKHITFLGHSRCAALEPHDIISVTHTFPGWSDKLFRIESVSLTPEGSVAIGAVEESTTLYNDTYDMSTHDFYDTTLPSPSGTIPNVTSVAVSEVAYAYANRTFSRLNINFDPPAETDYPWWDHAEIWVSIGDSANYKMLGNSETDFSIDPAQELTTYYIKIVGVNIWGAREDFAVAYSASYYVSGKSTKPQNPGPISVMCAGDVVTIYAEDIDYTAYPDIEGYEVRLGDAWAGGFFVGVFQSASIRIPGIKPGSYTFWLATRDNRGVYSDTKQSGTITVFYPPNYADQNTWSWDYSSTGVFSNALSTSYGSTVVLASKHSSESGFQNLNMSSGIADWSTNESSISTYASSSINGIAITAGATAGGIYQQSTFTPRLMRMNYGALYKVSSDSTGHFDINIDARSSNLATKTLARATEWTSFSTYVDLPWYSTFCEIYIWADAGKTMHIGPITMTPATQLQGQWRSPEYDLGVRKKVRVWGDFNYTFAGSEQKWSAVPSSFTWTEIEATAKKWYELTNISQAAKLSAILYAGDNPSSYTSTNHNFQLTAPEVFARYLKVHVEIVDPDAESYLYLRNLNMKAAYWTTLNTT